MNISEIEKLSFQLLTKVFFYLWPYPVKWNETFTEIELIKPAKKLISFCISISILFCFGVMPCITCAVISKRPEITRVQCGIQLLIGTGILTITTITFQFFMGFSSVVSAFNQFLALAQKLEKGKKTRVHATILNIIF